MRGDEDIIIVISIIVMYIVSTIFMMVYVASWNIIQLNETSPKEMLPLGRDVTLFMWRACLITAMYFEQTSDVFMISKRGKKTTGSNAVMESGMTSVHQNTPMINIK